MPNSPAPSIAPARTVPDPASILIRAQAFVDRKYVTRADDRQREMGLAYVEAERQDLAREIVRFVIGEIAALSRETDPLEGVDFVGLAVTNVHTGYNASIEYADGQWSPHEFATTAADAIRKCIRLHGPVRPVVLAPPPY